jgi:hypothetical protein
VKTPADTLRRQLERIAHQAATIECEEVIEALKKNDGQHVGREFFADRGTKIVQAWRRLEQAAKNSVAAPSPAWGKTREDVEAGFKEYIACREESERLPATLAAESEPSGGPEKRDRKPARQAPKAKRRRVRRPLRRPYRGGRRK